ncbi:MAG: hypothetical protein P4N59_25705, partial [Negativicutes bacterium]|nr:hypothetical protein [Negativicutes bacterium]
GHALVGCGSSVASGGSCGSGALSGGVGAALSPITQSMFPNARTDFGQRIGGTIIEATAGGLASVAGGGKFANGAVTGAFGYLFNATLHVGGSVEIPGFAANAITSAYQWLTGDGSFVMGNGISVGAVVQYTGAADKAAGQTVPYDAGLYAQVSAPAGGAEIPSLNLSASGELGVGTGTIHGTFDGLSYNYNVMVGSVGGTATYVQGPNGNLTLSGVAVRSGEGLGVSANASITGAVTARDIIGYGH